jgi:hypothetical protein
MDAALQLAPFCGIAFLWFLGTIRNRLGVLEDRFFSTVLVGSSFLFIACLYGATALSIAAEQAISAGDLHVGNSDAYVLLRRASVALMNVLAMKMAGAFIFSLCVIGLRTHIFPHWISYLGVACGIVLLAVISSWLWITLLFPLWTLILSVGILLYTPPQFKTTSLHQPSRSAGQK